MIARAPRLYFRRFGKLAPILTNVRGVLATYRYEEKRDRLTFVK